MPEEKVDEAQTAEEEEPQEPEEKPETEEEKPSEAEGLQLTDEQIEALLSTGEPPGAEPTPAPPQPAPEPQKPAPAREPAPEPMETDEQSFMPQGQNFDPYEAYTPGTASFNARVKAEEARVGRYVSQAIQSDRERTLQTEYQRKWAEFVSANPDMKDERKRQAFEQFLMTTSVDGVQLDYNELYNAMRFTKAMRTQQRRKGAKASRDVPPPVTIAPRSAVPKEPDDLRKKVEDLIGPERSAY